MIMSILLLARATGVTFADDPMTQLTRNGEPVEATYIQHPVISQIVDGGVPGIPWMAVARLDRHRPHPRARREHRVQRLPGARLDPGARRLPAPPAAHPRRPAGVLATGSSRWPLAAIALIIAFNAEVTRLHPALHRRRLRCVLGEQLRHDPSLDTTPAHRDWIRPKRTKNAAQPGDQHDRGITVTGIVLVVVLITKFVREHLDRDHRHARADLLCDEGSASALRVRTMRPSSLVGRRVRPRVAEPGARDRSGVPSAPPHAGEQAYARASRPQLLES